MTCLNCSKIFIRFDHVKDRKPKYCCHKCFIMHYRKVCIKCGDDTIKHRKYKLRGKKAIRRDCIICERDDANEYKRKLYNENIFMMEVC